MATDLAHRLLRVVESGAVAAARTTGQGDGARSDRQATEAMRAMLQGIPMRGRVVIGKGERQEAPMLYVGEEVGHWQHSHPRVDLAADPLEGTRLCAAGAQGALAVLAAAEEDGLRHVPDCYMNKLIVGPRSRGRVSLDAPVEENLKAIADSLARNVTDLLVVVLERQRHEELIAGIRAAGARIRLIRDGDISPAISACVTGTAVHAVMGIGGAPEGVITAAAVRCLGGEMQGRYVEARPGDRDRAEKMGVREWDRIRSARDLAPGSRLIFAATGITDGELLKGVAFFGAGCRTHSLVMGLEAPRRVRFVDTIHLGEADQGEIRLF
ncbi:MAG: class II fructose-bisphosphatase [Planctomycetota bacterium]|jgi:fructose-1,6-bisphosphatase class II